jgi:Flp pilus assembly protein TadG
MSEQLPISKRKSAMRQAIHGFIGGPNGVAGTVLVEFAIIAPMMILLTVAGIDFGMLAYSQLEVQHAAQAGAQYAIECGCSSSTAISSAVQNATTTLPLTLPGGISATSSEACGCPTSSGVNFASCSCSNVGTYVTVNATATYHRILPLNSIFATSSPITLTSSARVRIQ